MRKPRGEFVPHRSPSSAIRENPWAHISHEITPFRGYIQKQFAISVLVRQFPKAAGRLYELYRPNCMKDGEHRKSYPSITDWNINIGNFD